MGLIALAGVAAGACSDKAFDPDVGPGITIEVAALELPGVSDACYNLSVTNALGQPVWSRSTICASSYGAGADISYVAPCDATPGIGGATATNTVTLTIASLSGPQGAITDYVDPCAAPHNPLGCQLPVVCRENADAPVTFNLTLMRRANQGFFDVAVNFDDIFCSAKVDCEDADGDALQLVHDPASAQRVDSVVLGFACTSGGSQSSPATSTHLYRNPIEVVCPGQTAVVDPSTGPGNLYNSGSPAPAPLVQAMVFEGTEALQNGATNDPAGKLYWNVALGLDTSWIRAQPASSTCVLRTSMTASEGPLTEGSVAPGIAYPVIRVEVPLWTTGPTGARICSRHPLDGAPAGVETGFTRLDSTQPTRFAFFGAASAGDFASSPVTALTNECAAEVSPCPGGATCRDMAIGFECDCPPGYEGGVEGCTNINECGAAESPCQPDEICTDEEGGFACDGCPPGTRPDGATCIDIDECLEDSDGCDPHATCFNSDGSFECNCNEGWTASGDICVDVDECGAMTATCGPETICLNTEGDYQCQPCEPGFEVVDGACVDVDECLVDNGGCGPETQWSCVNVVGGPPECTCVSTDAAATALVEKGDSAPGIADAQFDMFDSPRIGAGGHYAFLGFVSGPGVSASDNTGIWRGRVGTPELELVLRLGQTHAGQPIGIVFSSGVNINAVGQVAVATGSGTDRALWRIDMDGSVVPLAVQGQAIGGATLDELDVDPLINEDGLVAFRARTDGVANLYSLFVVGATGEVTPVAVRGQPLGNLGVVVRGVGNVTLDRHGMLVFGLTTEPNDEGMVVTWRSAQGVTRVAGSGDPVPGAPGQTLDINLGVEVDTGGSGEVAFTASLAGGAPNVRGLFRWSPEDGVSIVGKTGDAVPYLGAGVTWLGFNYPSMNGAGELAYLGDMTGDGITAANQTMWVSEGLGGPHRVTQTGEVIAGSQGLPVGSPLRPVLNDLGQQLLPLFFQSVPTYCAQELRCDRPFPPPQCGSCCPRQCLSNPFRPECGTPLCRGQNFDGWWAEYQRGQLTLLAVPGNELSFIDGSVVMVSAASGIQNQATGNGLPHSINDSGVILLNVISDDPLTSHLVSYTPGCQAP